MPSVLKVNEVQSDTDLPLVFNVGNAERGRINTSGLFLVGTTTAPSSTDVKLFVNSSGGGFAGFAANGTPGGAIGCPTTSTLTLYTAAGTLGAETYTERMRLDASGNLGIGGTPVQRLDVFGVTSDATPVALLRAYTTGADGVRTVPVRFVSSNNNNWANAQYEAYNHNFNGNGTLVFLVKQEGAVVLKGGDTNASGTGITFPATQSASTNANTLDDYEEGDWTPSVGGNATYTDRYGRYTKIGNIVTCQFFIQIGTIGTGSTTNLLGFPFTSANIGYVQTGCVSYYSSLAVNTIFVSLYVQPNATNCLFVGKAASGATVDNGIGLFGNNTAIYGTVTYRVA